MKAGSNVPTASGTHSIGCESQSRVYFINKQACNITGRSLLYTPPPFAMLFQDKLYQHCGYVIVEYGLCSQQNDIAASNIHSRLWSAMHTVATDTWTWSISCSRNSKRNVQSHGGIYMHFLEWSVKVKDVAPMWNWKQTQLLHKYDL